MDDRKPVNDSSDEIEDSPKDNDDGEDVFQDKSEESGGNPATLENQVLPTSSRLSVPASASSTHPEKIDQIVDALLSLRQNRSGRVDALSSPRKNPTDSSMPVLEHSDVSSTNTKRKDRSPLGKDCNNDFSSPPQPPPVRMTRSLSKARNMQKMLTPSPEKQSVETGVGPTSAKRRRTETPESDSGKSGNKYKSFRSKLSPSASARTLDESPINVQSRKVRATARESESPEGKMSISSRDCSPDSDSLAKDSNPDDLRQDTNFINLSTEENEATTHFNISTDASSASPNKNSVKSRKGSSASNTWIVMKLDSPDKDPGSLKFKRILTDVASSSNESTTEDYKTSMEVKTQEFASVSSDETMSASNMAHLATEILMPESNQSRPTIENFDLPSKVLDSGMETREFKPSPYSPLFLNPHLSLSCHFPEQSSSPRNLPEIQDPEVLTEENRSDPLLQRQHSGSISSGASKSKERSEMDLDPPYLDVHEGEPSTSSHQPVITDGFSAGDRFNSSSNVTPSGATRDRAIKSKTSAKEISKYASRTQTLLLNILEDMVEFNEELDRFRRLREPLLAISQSPCFISEIRLQCELMTYLVKRRTDSGAENVLTAPVLTLKHYTEKVYEILIRIVVTALFSTVSKWSSLNFGVLMANYSALRNLCEGFSLFWRNNNVEDIPDEASRNRVKVLTDKIQILMLRTRIAFKELLMHIGEHADEGITDKYAEELWDDDKNFLRRRVF